MTEKLAKHMSLYQHDIAPDITSHARCSADAVEELIDQCDEKWRHMEKLQNKLTLLGTETVAESDAQLTLLMMQVKALTAECNQWQKRTPELLPDKQEVLLAVGKEELQKVDHELEMVRTCVQSKNKKLKDDLQREQKWLEEQQQLVEALTARQEELRNQVVEISEKRLIQELNKKIVKIRRYEEELLRALGEFLEEHFPLPEEQGNINKKKKGLPTDPPTQLITLHEILETLINKLTSTPHQPYLTLDETHWPPYIEMLLRYGIALRHPEDPSKIRLEAFHQ
ncbi:centromere protein K isoform X2 [Rhinatrema bivittatum]|uniref:centromere protein K isoform X2 n=1 Tax=Rhinatrema bivittatum TaxID=194408 RepID=UPI0011279E72|nr:centromere protein K isoform X2 [Rhinatrema bivittatum]